MKRLEARPAGLWGELQGCANSPHQSRQAASGHLLNCQVAVKAGQ